MQQLWQINSLLHLLRLGTCRLYYSLLLERIRACINFTWLLRLPSMPPQVMSTSLRPWYEHNAVDLTFQHLTWVSSSLYITSAWEQVILRIQFEAKLDLLDSSWRQIATLADASYGSIALQEFRTVLKLLSIVCNLLQYCALKPGLPGSQSWLPSNVFWGG